MSAAKPSHLPREHLGRRVRLGAAHVAERPAAVEDAVAPRVNVREAKVDELDDAGLVEEDVLELEVAVRHPAEVAVRQPVEHLAKEVARDLPDIGVGRGR